MGALIASIVTIVLCLVWLFIIFIYYYSDSKIWRLENKIKREKDRDRKELEGRILRLVPTLVAMIIGIFMFFSISIAIHVYTVARIASMTTEIIEVHEKNQELQRKEEYYKGYIRHLENQLDTSTINHQ